jgi:hypothetical protein
MIKLLKPSDFSKACQLIWFVFTSNVQMEMLERQKNEVIAYHFEETAFARLILHLLIYLFKKNRTNQ